MRKETLELLVNFLGIEKREDWKESNKGNLVDINLDSIQDQAYIRSQFKRFLLNCKNSNMVITSNRLQGYRVDLSRYDFTTLEGRNKLLNTIDFTTKEILSENEVPAYLKFEF